MSEPRPMGPQGSAPPGHPAPDGAGSSAAQQASQQHAQGTGHGPAYGSTSAPGWGSGHGSSASHYPRQRPDFEPPPDWARPRPGVQVGSSGNGLPPTRPYGDRDPERDGRRLPKTSVLIGIAVALSLIAGGAGAAAGVYFTMKYGQSVSVEPLPPPKDNLGNRAQAFDKPQNVTKVANRLLPSVVQIKTSSTEGKATGSGFVIDGTGHIVTNNHVVELAKDSGSITTAFEDGQEVSARIVGRSPSYDLAVIKVKGVRNLRPVALGNSDKLVVGEPIVAVGAPLGLHGTVTSGIVSARNRPVTAGGQDEGNPSFINAIQSDAAINPGNSGGPLVNLRAEVVGVNTAIATVGGEESPFGEEKQSGNIGVGFSIPINQVRRTVKQLIDDGRAVYPVVGAQVDAAYTGPGARMQTVKPGGGAHNAGLRSGDVVTSINGAKVSGGDDLIVKIRSHLPGQRIAVEYSRDGQDRRVTVKLDEEIDD